MADLAAASPPEPEAENRKPSVHDALLINLVSMLELDFASSSEEMRGALDLVKRTLPFVSRDTIRMRDLADAAERLVVHSDWRTRRAGDGEANPWHRARFDARMALWSICRWRAAQLQGRVFPAEGAA